eukprot:891680-Amphidinium_carterae.2
MQNNAIVVWAQPKLAWPFGLMHRMDMYWLLCLTSLWKLPYVRESLQAGAATCGVRPMSSSCKHWRCAAGIFQRRDGGRLSMVRDRAPAAAFDLTETDLGGGLVALVLHLQWKRGGDGLELWVVLGHNMGRHGLIWHCISLWYVRGFMKCILIELLDDWQRRVHKVLWDENCRMHLAVLGAVLVARILRGLVVYGMTSDTSLAVGGCSSNVSMMHCCANLKELAACCCPEKIFTASSAYCLKMMSYAKALYSVDCHPPDALERFLKVA